MIIRAQAKVRGGPVKGGEAPAGLKLTQLVAFLLFLWLLSRYGVGPVLEKKLHALGIKTYAEIAAWTADDIARIDDELNFKGRIERDGWLDQVKTLIADKG